MEYFTFAFFYMHFLYSTGSVSVGNTEIADVYLSFLEKINLGGMKKHLKDNTVISHSRTAL